MAGIEFGDVVMKQRELFLEVLKLLDLHVLHHEYLDVVLSQIVLAKLGELLVPDDGAESPDVFGDGGDDLSFGLVEGNAGLLGNHPIV